MSDSTGHIKLAEERIDRTEERLDKVQAVLDEVGQLLEAAEKAQSRGRCAPGPASARPNTQSSLLPSSWPSSHWCRNEHGPPRRRPGCSPCRV